MVVEKNQKQFWNPLVIGNLTMFLKLFYDAYEGNDNVKRPRTPMCGTRGGSGTVSQMWLTEARGIATL
jgi:hypothetical protein